MKIIMAVKKPNKIINQKEIEELLSLKEEDITSTLIYETFGEFNSKTKYNTFDEFTVPAKAYKNGNLCNEKPFITTTGSWIFNKFFIEKDLMHVFGYTNEEVTSGYMKKMNAKLSYALLEGDIEVSVLRKFLMKTQAAMPWVTPLSANHTIKMLTLAKEIEPKKKELLKKYAKEIEAGDAEVAEKIEAELLDYAKNVLKDDEAYQWILSGYRASWGNNIKNMYVMKGAIKDPITGRYNIVTSNLASGISKEDYPAMCNALSAGPYSRAQKTSLGGYWEKLLLYAYQHLQLLDEGSDCKTDKYITVNFTEEKVEDYMYSYIIEGSKLTEITSKNMDKYKGQKVKLRFISMCHAKDGICHKCAGNFFYRLGIKNVGILAPSLGSKLKNLSMKAFHDSTVSLTEIDVNKAFTE
jgi:hypothetical protein